jgi:hypothetical protein
MIEGPTLMRWVVGYEGRYLVRRDGCVFDRRAHQMAARIDRYGYVNVRLSLNGKQSWKKAHRLVCEAWHGPCPAGKECGHLDGEKANNRPENLAWITRSENELHKFDQGVRLRRQPKPFVGQSQPGERNPAAKLSNAQATEIRQRLLTGESCRSLGRAYGVSKDSIHRIKAGHAFHATSGETPNISP